MLTVEQKQAEKQSMLILEKLHSSSRRVCLLHFTIIMVKYVGDDTIIVGLFPKVTKQTGVFVIKSFYIYILTFKNCQV